MAICLQLIFGSSSIIFWISYNKLEPSVSFGLPDLGSLSILKFPVLNFCVQYLIVEIEGAWLPSISVSFKWISLLFRFWRKKNLISTLRSYFEKDSIVANFEKNSKKFFSFY